MTLDSTEFEALIHTSASLRGQGRFKEAIATIEAKLDQMDETCLENAYPEIIYAAEEGGFSEVARRYVSTGINQNHQYEGSRVFKSLIGEDAVTDSTVVSICDSVLMHRSSCQSEGTEEMAVLLEKRVETENYLHGAINDHSSRQDVRNQGGPHYARFFILVTHSEPQF
jgi:hypothetical protein